MCVWVYIDLVFIIDKGDLRGSILLKRNAFLFFSFLVIIGSYYGVKIKKTPFILRTVKPVKKRKTSKLGERGIYR